MEGPSTFVDESPAEEAGLAGGSDTIIARRVLRKIDMRLVPLLFFTYMLNFLDKTILSSAAVFGLAEDTVGGTY